MKKELEKELEEFYIDPELEAVDVAGFACNEIVNYPRREPPYLKNTERLGKFMQYFAEEFRYSGWLETDTRWIPLFENSLLKISRHKNSVRALYSKRKTDYAEGYSSEFLADEISAMALELLNITRVHIKESKLGNLMEFCAVLSANASVKAREHLQNKSSC